MTRWYSTVPRLGRPREQHGESKGPSGVYSIWKAMVMRCLNPHTNSYKWYGAKGIRVCDRWRDSFVAFRDDMGPRPKGTSIDRIDGSKGYEPGNCRWATCKEQTNNRGVTRKYTAFGETKTAIEWLTDSRCRAARRQNIYQRIVLYGWDAEVAITTPVLPLFGGKNRKKHDGTPIRTTFDDLTGRRFGRHVAQWTVGRVRRTPLWLCVCDCGNLSICYASNLTNGKSLSCGCFRTRLLKHRRWGTRLDPGDYAVLASVASERSNKQAAPLGTLPVQFELF